MDIQYGDKITFEDFNALRGSVGWELLSRRQFDCTVRNAVFICVAYDGGKPIGMTRGIGDGGYNLLVSDVIVLEEYRHHGIAKEMMDKLFEYIDDNTLEGETMSINLMAAKGRESFYEQFGFISRPTENRGAGMSMYYKKEAKE